MAKRPIKRFVVYGGGEVAVNPSSEVFVDKMLELAATASDREPFVVVAATARFKQATHDKVVNWATAFFASRGVPWKMLHEHNQAPELEEAAADLMRATAIYVPGGNTEYMLKFWREHGLTDLIIDAINRGVVIGGISAGLLFAFEQCHTDSDQYTTPDGQPWNYRVIDGLGILPGYCCPHANDNVFEFTLQPEYEGTGLTRRDHSLAGLQLMPNRPNAIAVDNHTAIVVEDDEVTVMGRGRVSLYLKANDFHEVNYLAGDRFSLSSLRQ